MALIKFVQIIADRTGVTEDGVLTLPIYIESTAIARIGPDEDESNTRITTIDGNSYVVRGELDIVCAMVPQ